MAKARQLTDEELQFALRRRFDKVQPEEERGVSRSLGDFLGGLGRGAVSVGKSFIEPTIGLGETIVAPSQVAIKEGRKPSLLQSLLPLALTGPVGATQLVRGIQEGARARRTREQTIQNLDRQLGKTEDKKVRELLLNLKQQTQGIKPQSIKEVEALSKTNKQVLAEIGLTGLEVLTAGTGSGVLKSLGVGAKMARAGKFARAGGRLVRGAGLGAAFGGAEAVREGVEKPGEIAKSAAAGAALGGALDVAAPGIARIFKKGKGRRVAEETIEESTGLPRVDIPKNTGEIVMAKEAVMAKGVPSVTAKEAVMAKGVPSVTEKEAVMAKGVPSVTEDVQAILRGEVPTFKERGFIKTVKRSPNTPEAVKEMVEGQYIPKSNDLLSKRARDRIYNDINEAQKVAFNSIDDEGVATAIELQKKFNREGDFARSAEIANRVAKNLTEAGRTVQAAALINRQSPEGIQRFAQGSIENYNRKTGKKIRISPEENSKLFALASEIKKMPEGIAKTEATVRMMDEVASLIPTPPVTKALTLWKAGLLTSIKTIERNSLANTLNLASETAAKIPGAAADFALSLLTGKRTLTATLKGLPSGAVKGVKEGGRFMKTGIDLRGDVLRKFDLKKVNWGDSKLGKAAKVYTDGIFRFMGAQDRPFYTAALSNSLYDQAQAKAINLGKRGNRELVEKLVLSPTEDMTNRAIKDAKTSIFQQDTVLGDAITKAQAAANRKSLAFGSVIDFLFPFKRTPTGVATQLFQMSPAGAITETIKAIHKKIQTGKFDQRDLAQAIGRSTVGTTVMAVGASLMNSGLMTLDWPETERERNLWELEGKKPFSLKVGGKWRSIGSIGPQATSLLVGGFNARGGIVQAIAGAGKALKEQTFLKGMSSVLNAIDDPERFGPSFLKQSAKSIVPTIISDVARGRDPLQRVSKTPLEGIKERIPGLRETLGPRVTALGEIEEQPGGLKGSLLDLFLSSPEKSGTVVDELRRLEDAGDSITPTKIKEKVSVRGTKLELSEDDKNALQILSGGIINDSLDVLFKHPAYIALPDEEKEKLIRKIVDQSRKNAKDVLFVKKKQ